MKDLITTIRDTLHEEMELDPRVIVLGEDVVTSTFGATADLASVFGEERVIDTPLAESSIVGIAIGAAMDGMLPVAEIQFADFIYPAVDQIISEAAKMRYRSNGDFSAPIVVRSPYGGGLALGPYHSQCVESLFMGVPGLKIAVPATPRDAKGLLRAAIHDPDPVLFLEPKRAYRAIKEEVPEHAYMIPLGKADIKREGDDITVITYGWTLHQVLEAAESLAAEEGVQTEVVDLRCLLPLDRQAVVEAAKKTGKVLVVHEDNLTAGPGAEVVATITSEAFWHLDAPVRRIAAPDVPSTPFNRGLESNLLPSTEEIREAMLALARY